MSTDEIQILEFLKTSDEAFSAPEISRRVGGKARCEREPNWAKPVLLRLFAANVVIMDEYGYFRCAPPPKSPPKREYGEKPKPLQREETAILHLSPQIAGLLDLARYRRQRGVDPQDPKASS